MKLVACPRCHAQYDLADVAELTVSCPCGASFPASSPVAVDAAVTRCASCGALVGDADTTCSYCKAEIARRPAPAGPVCPECYARNPEGARHCTSCGIAFLPQPVHRNIGTLECPVCAGVRLAARSLGGLWVDECPMCLGLWIPGDIMDRLVERVRERRHDDPAAAVPAHRERRAAWQATVAYRHCPECRGAMQRRNFGRRSGVIVDWCGSHGTWLDVHEMEDVAAFVLAGGLEREPAGESSRDWALPADPARTAAIVAAEGLLAEERRRAAAERGAVRHLDSERVLRSLGDWITGLLRK